VKHYRIVFTPTAKLHALQAAEFISHDSVTYAIRWYEGLLKAINSLQTMPGRCGLARESEHFPDELRQYIYHSHRVIFRIDDASGLVYILHIRHAARQAIGEDQED
jgi:plasmid stabilization system protein ParE